jgi:hypothetical protein
LLRVDLVRVGEESWRAPFKAQALEREVVAADHGVADVVGEAVLTGTEAMATGEQAGGGLGGRLGGNTQHSPDGLQAEGAAGLLDGGERLAAGEAVARGRGAGTGGEEGPAGPAVALATHRVFAPADFGLQVREEGGLGGGYRSPPLVGELAGRSGEVDLAVRRPEDDAGRTQVFVET